MGQLTPGLAWVCRRVLQIEQPRAIIRTKAAVALGICDNYAVLCLGRAA